MKAAGVTPIHSTFTDLDKIEELAAQADIVVNAAQFDSGEVTHATLRGLKKRKEGGCGVASLIHTSGTGIFLDGGKEGKYTKPSKIMSVRFPRQLKPSCLNRSSVGYVRRRHQEPYTRDDARPGRRRVSSSQFTSVFSSLSASIYRILHAGLEGYVNTFIVCPGAVYGIGTGPAQRSRACTFVKNFVPLFIQKGKAMYVGEGSSEFPWVRPWIQQSTELRTCICEALTILQIHTDDLVEIYLAVFAQAIGANKKLLQSSPYARYYVGASYSRDWKTVVAAAAAELHKRGDLPTPTPKSVAPAEFGFFGRCAVCNVKFL